MNDKTAIVGARIFDGALWHDDTAVLIEDGRVSSLCSVDVVPDGFAQIDANGLLAVPGFIDLQVNGGGGVMFNNQPDVAGIAQICAAHAAFGTTALMATVITDTSDIVARAAQAGVSAQQSRLPGFLGIHFEGPHLSVARKGTHDPALIRPMEQADLDALLNCKQQLDHVIVTLAPENATTGQVQALARAGITVSLGHSDENYGTALEYIQSGASMMTHLFNAMSPLGHREPGMVGAALNSGDIYCGMIADGFHVDPASMALALRAKASPGKIFLVTDAMSTIGTDDAGFELNGRPVYRNGGRLTLADGTLAGADIDMLSCIRFVHEKLDVSLDEALRMASTYPADAIRAKNKGRLKQGFDADFVLLNPNMTMHSTWIAGNKVFQANSQQGV